MSAAYDDDSDYGSDVEGEFSNVHLGLADGPLEGDDEFNPLVSRIGGRPAWLPLSPKKLPPASLVNCAHCQQPMQLLVEIFAPLEDSPFDRNLFVWGCSRAKCQRLGHGSIKAIRMMKHNVRWAAKLAKQAERRRIREERAAAKARAEQEAEAERLKKERETNPFSMKSTTGSSLFGASLFSEIPASAESTERVAEASKEDIISEEEDDDDDDDDFNEEERLAEELAIKASLDEQRAQLQDDWARTASHYETPLYLNTIPEPMYEKDVDDAAASEPSETVPMSSGEGEQYEKMTIDGVDDVFERFARRLSSEARQVVRYEFEGTPLPFHAAGPLFQQLWPAGLKGGYDSSAVPRCERCNAPRVFELQLMPNLANLLRKEHLSEKSDVQGTAEEQRQAEIASLLGISKEGVSDVRTGIAWSTAIVFVCSKDCCAESEGWAEEWVGLQQETE